MAAVDIPYDAGKGCGCWWFDATRRCLCVSCPGCGVESDLSNHSIGADGMVNPKVRCPCVACGFSRVIRLLDWTGWLVSIKQE